MSEPDLFVVCKNCSAEVSPYITECPYCGQRVRKRAPKIEKEGGGPAPPRRRFRAPSLPKLRRDEIPGIAVETRPYATMAVVALSMITIVALSAGALVVVEEGGLVGPPGEEWWRLFTTPFVYGDASALQTTSLGYAFIALLAVGLFGLQLERRFGPATLVAIFLLCGAAGGVAAVATGLYPAVGANGAALGMLCAWLVEDRLATGRGEDRGSDLLGAGVFAVVLLLLPLTDTNASVAATAGGALAGLVLGLGLGAFRR